MPRPGLPPTPGSSSDIKGKDGTHQLATFQLSFELPPPAIHDASRMSPTMSSQVSPTNSKSHPLNTTSPVATYPMQPAETVKARRRSSATREAKDNSFALPPPPTRSRKIIQMKPRQDDGGDNNTSKDKGKATSKSSATTKTTATATGSKATAAVIVGDASADDKTKKKQPSATSAAGRKIARKTAHSLIERRRRSKMNEEFAVLKGMIPACTGDMHKLSILQASIEYIRYLEDCVSKLKAQQEEDNGQTESERQTPTGRDRLPSIREFHPTFQGDPADDDDVEMEDSDVTSPAMTAMQDHHARHPSVSPALGPQDSRHRAQSYSSATTESRRYSYSVSAGTSPAFGPQIYGAPHYARSDASAPGSALTSPALNPQSELDQEAMAALLMLNNDRRDSKGRGLSVRDLLST
ncbi:sterol regulatory element-binding 2 [Fusarium heterosporum]|uniref:Sterol regulatory element-binding 2 n=1 Tax=Fusarium heterosporum TaxID=42747 RepID=A0A8H5TMV9_FUSHE|nr:sterol regulatory element-binding 2 [Fusarium heterosporum]